jgi:UDP-GlcNAc:undecaprenyl-phosphate GlcNAc-1-phosphate transferase
MIRLAKRYDIVDKPNQAHKTHAHPVPYLGGFAIVIPLSLAFLLSPLYFQGLAISYNEFLGFIIAPIILSIVGAIDDKKQLATIPRFILQVSVSTILLSIFVSEDWFGNAFSSPALNFTISLIWMVGITNSLNFFDNLDGGAAGFSVIASFAIFIMAFSGGQSAVALMAIALSGSCLGFLYWNRNPARIYLGDAGALFVGMMLAALLVRLDPIGPNKAGAFLTPVLVMAIPIIDTSVAVLSRIKRKVSPFLGGRDHLSHRLQRRGFTRKQSAIMLWILSGYFCFSACVLQLLTKTYSTSLVILSVISGLVLFLWFLIQPDSD